MTLARITAALLLGAAAAAPTLAFAQQKTFQGTHVDRATACASANRQAEQAARQAIGAGRLSTSQCDCSRTSYDPQTAQGIAVKSVHGDSTVWTCQVTATLQR